MIEEERGLTICIVSICVVDRGAEGLVVLSSWGAASAVGIRKVRRAAQDSSAGGLHRAWLRAGVLLWFSSNVASNIFGDVISLGSLTTFAFGGRGNDFVLNGGRHAVAKARITCARHAGVVDFELV